MFGLKNDDIKEIVSILKGFPEVEQAIMFGSRAMGNYRKGSDIDIALAGQKANFDIALKIGGILNEETYMPYHFDVLSLIDNTNKDLADHIDRHGKLLYRVGDISISNGP
ncbi:MAG: nucleotidyltransferase domain-containing protein [Cyclobacteriaceae bacterium]|nr:nucleotidyltransferase domain-containing protein [Cyclobacteriaceae bacterium]